MLSTRRWLDAHQLLLWKAVIIIAVLVLSTGLAVVSSETLTLLIIVILVLLAGVLLLLQRPAIGLDLLIAGNLIFPLEIIHEIGLTSLIILGLTALWIFDMVAGKRKVILLNSPAIPPLLVFLVVTILAFLVGQLHWYPIDPAPLDGQIGGILILVVVVAAFFLVAHQVKEIVWLKWIVFTFLGLSVIYIAASLFPQLRSLAFRFLPPQITSGSMFWAWMAAMAFSQTMFNKKLSNPVRVGLGLIVLANLYISLFPARAWISGWLPSLIAIFVILWVGAPRQARYITFVGGAVMLTQAKNLLDNLIYVGDNAYSQVTRLEAWRIIAQIIEVNPILGVGPANYSYYTPLFPILGWTVQFNSHNNYVDIVAQTGILGLICILWFIWAILKVAWRVYKMVPEGGFEQAYVYGVIGGIIATFASGMLGDWFLPYVYNATIRSLRTSIIPWLFMGGLLALEQILLQQQKSENEGLLSERQ